jgi:perosamine synthetase
MHEPWFEPESAEAAAAQVRSGFVGPGPATRAFAEALGLYIGVSHVVPTVSGTVALSVAVHALGLKPGDEVLIPAYGVISVINGLASAGIEARLVDIDAVTGSIDPVEIEKRITPRTKAVCHVDFSGHIGDGLLRTEEFCQNKKIPLIEDAACALGHSADGRMAGSFGDIATLSFSVPKIVTTGQGGALLTRKDALRDRAAAYIDQGDLDWRKTNITHSIGSNLRFNDVLAAIGLSQLKNIEARHKRRAAIWDVMKSRLSGYLFAPQGLPTMHHIVFAREADLLMAALHEKKIMAVRPYRFYGEHPPYKHLADSDFSNTRYWCEQAVYLPCGLALEPADAERMADTVLKSGVALSPWPRA